MLLRLSRGQGTGLRVRHSGGRHSKVVDVVADQNTLRADQFFARVGGDTITAVKAYGLSIPDGYGLTMTGNLLPLRPNWTA